MNNTNKEKKEKIQSELRRTKETVNDSLNKLKERIEELFIESYEYLSKNEPIHYSDKIRARKIRNALTEGSNPCLDLNKKGELDKVYNSYLHTYVGIKPRWVILYELWNDKCKKGKKGERGLYSNIKENKNISNQEKKALKEFGAISGDDVYNYLKERFKRLGNLLGLELSSFEIFNDRYSDGFSEMDLTIAKFKKKEKLFINNKNKIVSKEKDSSKVFIVEENNYNISCYEEKMFSDGEEWYKYDGSINRKEFEVKRTYGFGGGLSLEKGDLTDDETNALYNYIMNNYG